MEETKTFMLWHNNRHKQKTKIKVAKLSITTNVIINEWEKKEVERKRGKTMRDEERESK